MQTWGALLSLVVCGLLALVGQQDRSKVSAVLALLPPRMMSGLSALSLTPPAASTQGANGIPQAQAGPFASD